jgi:hypothetical protein
MSHKLEVPHGSLIWAVSARRPSSQVLVFARAGMNTLPVEVRTTEYSALMLYSEVPGRRRRLPALRHIRQRNGS